MLLQKNQWPIFAVVLAALCFFIVHFFIQQNFEFFIYVGVIVFFFLLILFTNPKVRYSNTVLWGLSLWAILHMAGGGLYWNGVRFYDLILLPLNETYQILKYDQAVHAFGFFVATLVAYEIIRPHLKPKHPWTALSIVLVMAGLGFGALNEIIEFFATLLAPSTGVGGYLNTALDLVFNFIGALLALLFIRLKQA